MYVAERRSFRYRLKCTHNRQTGKSSKAKKKQNVKNDNVSHTLFYMFHLIVAISFLFEHIHSLFIDMNWKELRNHIRNMNAGIICDCWVFSISAEVMPLNVQVVRNGEFSVRTLLSICRSRGMACSAAVAAAAAAQATAHQNSHSLFAQMKFFQSVRRKCWIMKLFSCRNYGSWILNLWQLCKMIAVTANKSSFIHGRISSCHAYDIDNGSSSSSNITKPNDTCWHSIRAHFDWAEQRIEMETHCSHPDVDHIAYCILHIDNDENQFTCLHRAH